MRNQFAQWACHVIAFMMLSISVSAQTLEQQKKISAQYNRDLLLKDLLSIRQKESLGLQKAIAYARAKRLPLKKKFSDGSYASIQRLENDSVLIYYSTNNIDASRSTRTNTLNTGGITGYNLDGLNMKAYIWDGGHGRATHQEYDGPGGNDRYSLGDATSASLLYHSAHVAGTIMAYGYATNAKGMAPQGKAIGYDWNSDLSEATTAASNGMLLSNHSYGLSSSSLPAYYFGSYRDDAAQWDNLQYNAPYYLQVKSAGNDGTTTYNTSPLDPTQPQYDKLAGMTTAKNNLVVASTNDANIDAQGNLVSVTISSFSSQGPTDDLRIKPDISGNGGGLFSTFESADNIYGTLSGTSMATPNVTGTLLLLQEQSNKLRGGFLKAASLKGLVLHTADDAGASGPDAIYGWGLINAKRAAETIAKAKNKEAVLNELTLMPGQTYSMTVTSDGVNKLMASISWTDPAGVSAGSTLNSSTARLVNDLDIRITKDGVTNLPWKLTSVITNAQADNDRDPFERVDVEGASGTYTITVTHKGTLTNGKQDYTLIITGISVLQTCLATVPLNVAATQLTTNSASMNWDAVSMTTYDLRYRISGTSTWTDVSNISNNSYSLTGLTPQTTYEAQVRSKCSDGTASAYSASVSFATATPLLTYCASNGTTGKEYLNRVIVGSFENISGNNNGYADYTASTISVTQGDNTYVYLYPAWPGSSRAETYRIWIDLNNDKDFDDAGELLLDLPATTNTINSGIIIIPASSYVGSTRMRISMKYNAAATTCETGLNGEVEDYTVNINPFVADTQSPTIPTGLSTSNITVSSLTLLWSASTDNKAVSSYDVFRDGTLIGNTNTTNIFVSGLSAGTSYSFTVKAKDVAGNISPSSNPLTATTLSLNYCTSSGTSTAREFISKFQVGTFVNSSGASGYTNYTTNAALQINLAQNSVYVLGITPAWNGSSRNETYRVWIDYNRDGDFADAGEQIYSQNKTSASNVSGSFSVPVSASIGITRMRVIMKYNTASTSCETNFSGETEDYSVNISAPGTAIKSLTTANGNIPSMDLSSTMKLYPNPVYGGFLQIQPINIQPKRLKIYNITGSKIMDTIFTKNLDVSALPKGIYIIELYDGRNNFRGRFIKN